MTSYASSPLEHYRNVWAADLEKVPFDKGPIGDLSADFAIMACPPHGSRRLWTYATLARLNRWTQSVLSFTCSLVSEPIN